MKLVKLFSREYSLIEHELVLLSLVNAQTSIPEIRYSFAADVSRKGMIDILVSKKDFDGNIRRILSFVKNDKDYLKNKFDQGMMCLNRLKKLPVGLPSKIKKMDDNQIIAELYALRDMMFDFSGFLDFTHYLGKAGVELSEDEIKVLGRYHDYRKTVFIDYCKLFRAACAAIAKKKGARYDLSYLGFSEIIGLLKGKLSVNKADELEEKRHEHYILMLRHGKEKIITDDFEKESRKIDRMIIKEESSELKGLAINKGKVQGEVLLISTKQDLSTIKPGKVLVTHMTNPDMTPVLKRALAIVTDDGGILCHAANVAREFGIIAVIGTKNATKVLKTGDIIEVDADNGIVRLLERKR
ncbi:MAG: PEP-utilizing enzyme [archaeon]